MEKEKTSHAKLTIQLFIETPLYVYIAIDGVR
jgi:hypothetical protein